MSESKQEIVEQVRVAALAREAIKAGLRRNVSVLPSSLVRRIDERMAELSKNHMSAASKSSQVQQ